MIRIGDTIRLSPEDKHKLDDITGFETPDIRTMEEFHAHIDACKRYWEPISDEGKLLSMLIARRVAHFLEDAADGRGQERAEARRHHALKVCGLLPRTPVHAFFQWLRLAIQVAWEEAQAQSNKQLVK